MSAYDIWHTADAAEIAHARALSDGVDPFSGAYAADAKRLHIEALTALEDVFGLTRGTCVKVYYQDWSE